MKIVTVGIPAYNRVDLLREALDSLVRQTFQDFDVLISNNASSENLGRVIADFPSLNIVHVRHPVSLGMVGNWQYSLLAPRTKYVAWLHDDDDWERDHLERAIPTLEAAPDVNLWSCATRHFRGRETVDVQTLRGCETEQAPRIFDFEETLPLWLYRQNSQCSSAVFRRSALDDVWWGAKGLCHRLDYLVLSQMALGGKWIYDPKPTAGFRIGNADKMSNKKSVVAPGLVQSIYVVRYLVDSALRTKRISETGLMEAVAPWPLLAKAGLFGACTVYFASQRLRSFAKKLRTRYPEILTSPGTSRGCAMAGRMGLWLLSAIELAQFVRSGWWPLGDQNPCVEPLSTGPA